MINLTSGQLTILKWWYCLSRRSSTQRDGVINGLEKGDECFEGRQVEQASRIVVVVKALLFLEVDQKSSDSQCDNLEWKEARR